MELAELNDYGKILGLQQQQSTNKSVFKLWSIYEIAHLLKLAKRNVLKTGGMFYVRYIRLTNTNNCKVLLAISRNLQAKMCMGLFYQNI